LEYTFKKILGQAMKQILRTEDGFPNVIGAADCKHIAIKAPTDTEDV